MDLKERTYSVLIVSATEKLHIALSEHLPPSRFRPVRTVSSIHAAERATSERSYDLVIVNHTLPDDAGVRFAIDVSNSPGSVALLLVPAELHETLREQVTPYGVFTLTKPIPRPMLDLALDWMCSARERLRQSEKKTLSFEEKMQEIRLVNRAKWLLITRRGMDEPQAHRFIEKQAMDRCIPKQTVAEEIIRSDSS